MDQRLYPLPDSVCGYADREEFDRARKESGQWIFWEDRVEMVLEGRYDEVKPLHIELSPTYICNFACPWCSCRTAREDWSNEDVFNHPNATESTVMKNEKIQRIMDHLAAYKIGIQWVGGEPTMNPLLYPMAIKANELGLKQCLFTNGSLLNTQKIQTLFEANLVFIRVSLDAVTKSVHEIHHGYNSRFAYSERVLNNIRSLVSLRRERNASTLIGISLVVDERNLSDVVPTADFLCQLCHEYGAGAVDYVIVRPTYQFYAAQLELKENTQSKLAELVSTGSKVQAMLEEVGIKSVVPESSFAGSEVSIPEDFGDHCLSCGWFGEVTPNGDMVICSDRYGNPNYFIGNLAQDSIAEIWNGKTRGATLDFVNRTSCFKQQCPRNGRGFYLNRIFHSIETYRRNGCIEDVRKWIEDLRLVLPRPEHSFFL
jgi:sulfatase maturation enzyme AslB (radical SAM superfamily)